MLGSGVKMNKKVVFPRNFIYSFITLMFSTLDNVDVTKGLFSKALGENGMCDNVADENALSQLEDLAKMLESIKEVYSWEDLKDEDKLIAFEFSGKEEEFEEENKKLPEEKEDDNPFLGLDFGEFHLGLK